MVKRFTRRGTQWEKNETYNMKAEDTRDKDTREGGTREGGRHDWGGKIYWNTLCFKNFKDICLM